MPRRRIVNRLKNLMADKGRREGRVIYQIDVAQETGLAKTTVDSYARNEVTRYDARVLETLLRYFECDLDDLLVFEEVDAPEGDKTLPEIETPELEVA